MEDAVAMKTTLRQKKSARRDAKELRGSFKVKCCVYIFFSLSHNLVRPG